MPRYLIAALLFLSFWSVGISSAQADCAAVFPGAREGRPANADKILRSWPWSGKTCWYQWREPGAVKARREAMRAECEAKTRPDFLHFQQDYGATNDGSNTCIFRLRGDRATESQPQQRITEHRCSPAASSCPSGQKVCDGCCIPDNASCCADGNGVYCPIRGQCCFNRSNPSAINGYVCCAKAAQCIYAEGQTLGLCVAPEDGRTNQSPRSRAPVRRRAEPQSTAQSVAISELSTRCKSQLEALLVGTQKKDREKVHAAYAALRAQCEDGIRKLAQAAKTRLPERRLSSRASAALAAAMNRQPGQSPSASGDRSGSRAAANTAPAYDIDEVIELGIGILGLLNGVANLQPNRPVFNVPAPAVRQPTNSSGRSAPPPSPAPRNRPSTITGTK